MTAEKIHRHGSNTLCGGFYREWSPFGANSIEAQVNAMETFTDQIERAAAENKFLIIMGDASLSTRRCDSPFYKMPYPSLLYPKNNQLASVFLPFSGFTGFHIIFFSF